MFLLGACSCRVKFMNPGWDLITDVDWDERLMDVQIKRDEEAEKNEEEVVGDEPVQEEAE